MRMTKEEIQAKILSYIREEIQNKGYPPSVREICRAVGLKSTSSVHAHLNMLEKEGLIRRDATKPRAIELMDNPLTKGRVVPLVGKVAAGAPILAQENIEEEIVLPQDLVRGGEVFALRVAGDSMIDAGIFNEDVLVVRKQQDALNGQIVVAMYEDEATVKRIFYEDGHVRLQPENPTMEPILLDSVDVLGLVVGLYRSIR